MCWKESIRISWGRGGERLVVPLDAAVDIGLQGTRKKHTDQFPKGRFSNT